ncbi:MAG TPA: redox-regulated ATPase YchF [Bacteroidales bacterium]|nr:redox-regulated ATPase YchF [Bacteroidales bacterium]
MSLHCGITGITNVGKSTIFNCVSDTKVETNTYAFSATRSNIGSIKVPDYRLGELEKLQPTEKIIPTTIEFVDIPGLARGSSRGEGVGNKFLGDIRNADALIHVLRCFEDDNLPHIDGSVDPLRDLENIDFELQVKDMESVTKKIVRLEKIAKSGDPDARKGIEVLKRLTGHIEEMKNVRDFDFKPGDKGFIDDLFLLTIKPVIYVCNVDDESAVNGNIFVDSVKRHFSGSDIEIIIIAGALEAEISELDNDEDRLEFLNDVGLSEPGVNKLVRSAYKMLDLQTFFTVGPKEIRAWTIRKGMTAPQAAGVIHSDMERGFIRAEVMRYDDFVSLGTEQACRDAGKFNVEGKNYIVNDGDILHIRFNV